MSSQLDLNCKTDDLCKSMLWSSTISVTSLLLFILFFFISMCLRQEVRTHAQSDLCGTVQILELKKTSTKNKSKTNRSMN